MQPWPSLQLLLLHLCVVLGRSLAAEFGPLGCYVDNEGNVRDLDGLAGRSTIGPYSIDTYQKGVIRNDMNLQLCSQICEIEQFKYFGVQYASNCFCGNSYGSQGVASSTNCHMACAGNSQQICGAGRRNSVYRQIYIRPIGHHFTRAVLLRLNGTSSSGPFHRSLQPVRSAAECVYRCDASCQAVLFHLDACHLLRFAAVPHELSSIEAGEFLIRV